MKNMVVTVIWVVVMLLMFGFVKPKYDEYRLQKKIEARFETMVQRMYGNDECP